MERLRKVIESYGRWSELSTYLDRIEAHVMTDFSHAIEKFAVELLEKAGYEYVYAPSMAPDSETPERDSFEDVLLLERLRSAMGRINGRGD